MWNSDHERHENERAQTVFLSELIVLGKEQVWHLKQIKSELKKLNEAFSSDWGNNLEDTEVLAQAKTIGEIAARLNAAIAAVGDATVVLTKQDKPETEINTTMATAPGLVALQSAVGDLTNAVSNATTEITSLASQLQQTSEDPAVVALAKQIEDQATALQSAVTAAQTAGSPTPTPTPTPAPTPTV